MAFKNFVAFAAICFVVVLLFSVFARSASSQEKRLELARGESVEVGGLVFFLADVSADFSRIALKVYNGSEQLSGFSVVEKGVASNLFGVTVLFVSGREEKGTLFASVYFSFPSAQAFPSSAAGVSASEARAAFANLFAGYPAASLKVVDAGAYWAVSGFKRYSTPAGTASVEGKNFSVPSYSFLDGAVVLVDKKTGAVARAWKTN